MAHISTVTGQFNYFDHQLGHPDWTGKRVLDFGGNIGNILLDPSCKIEPENYWCIDIVREAVIQGKERHPAAHFVLYDRYNHEFNPTGTVGLPIPDVGERFDFILGHSVFTHVSKAETLEYADRLLSFLTDEGRAAFSFIDPWWSPPEGRADEFSALFADPPSICNLRWRLQRPTEDKPETDVDALVARARQNELTWTTLVNQDQLILDPDDALAGQKGGHYITFCTPDYMRQLFPNGRIADPVPPVRLHCLVIDRTSRQGRSPRNGERHEEVR